MSFFRILRVLAAAVVAALFAGCTNAGNMLGISPNGPNAATSQGIHHHAFESATFHTYRRHQRKIHHAPSMRAMASNQSTWQTVWFAFRNGGPGNDYVSSVVFDPRPLKCTAPCYTAGQYVIKNGINTPTAIAVDANSDVFVANAAGVNSTVTEYVASNNYSAPCILQAPWIYNPQTLSLSADASGTGYIWVGSLANPAISKAQPGGTASVTRVTRPCDDLGVTSGPNPVQITGVDHNYTAEGWTGATFDNIQNPQSIAFAGNGMLSVADPGTTPGNVSNYSMNNTQGGAGRSITPFTDPQAMVFDNSNNDPEDSYDNWLFIADQGGTNLTGGTGQVTVYAPGACPCSPKMTSPTLINGVADPNAWTINAPSSIALEQDHAYDKTTGADLGVFPQNVWVVSHGVAQDGQHYLDQIDIASGKITQAIVGDYPGQMTNANGVIAVPWPGLPGIYYMVVIARGQVDALQMKWGVPNPNNSPACPRPNGTGFGELAPDNTCNYGKHFTPFAAASGSAAGMALALGP